MARGARAPSTMLVSAQANQPWSLAASTLLLIPQCKTLKDVHQIHARITTAGLLRNPSLAAKLIFSLSSSSHPHLLHFARHLVFSHPRLRTHLCLWNSVIRAVSRGQDPREAVILFALMLDSGVFPDSFTVSFVLKACSRVALFEEAMQIQGLMEKWECGSNLFLRNSLICLYSRCGQVDLARLLFDKMLERDSVSWNSMIDGYVKLGMMDPARELFDRMRVEDRNSITWNSIISGYVQLEDRLDYARALFDEMPDRDLVSWNTMIDGYVKHGRLDDALCLLRQMPRWDVITWANLINGYAKMGLVDTARFLFNKMPEKDVIAWNVMISGYVQNGNYTEALYLFHKMRTEGALAPDNASLVIALAAVAELGRVDEGIMIHEYLEKNGFCVDGKLGVALIDMYSKCGDIDKAMCFFKNSRLRTVDHWNAMIGGLAIHGLGDMALQLFKEMEMHSVEPDDITFIGVLTACSHAGLVEKGLSCFELMRRVHSIKPKVQHFGCVVDILGRAGMLEVARRVIEDMPIEPNDVVWRALLSACKNHGNVEIGQVAARHLIELDSCCSSSYVLLSNLYAGAGLWEDVSKVRLMMKKNEIQRIPGCTWIEIDGSVHEFVVGDQSHPQSKEIYLLLDKMSVHLVQTLHPQFLGHDIVDASLNYTCK